MAFQPQAPFPKSRGDMVRSTDWNDLVAEVQRLDNDKVNRAGDKVGSLTITGTLGVGTGADDNLQLQVQSSGATRSALAVLSTPNNEDFLSLSSGRRNRQLALVAWKRGDLRVGTAAGPDGASFKELLRVNSSDSAAARVETDGRLRVGQLMVGPWPANPAGYGFVGVNSLDQTQAGNYALLQGTGSDNGTTYVNSPSSVRLRIGNGDRLVVASDGTIGISNNSNMNFGNQTRQMLTLWNPDYGIGIQSSTMYFRTGGNFAWYQGSGHNDNVFHPGNGGKTLMRMDGNGNIFIRGTISQNVNFNDPRIVIGPVIDPGIPPIVVNPSDERLKRNVVPLRGALARVLQLRGVTFEWNELGQEEAQQENGEEPQIGFIAQEVEAVFPQWVRSSSSVRSSSVRTGSSNGSEDSAGEGYKHLAIRGFEALAVEALRELQAEVEQLRARVVMLEGQLAAV
jgi:hypothetical protein